MGVFHVFKIVHMVLNRVTHHIYKKKNTGQFLDPWQLFSQYEDAQSWVRAYS